jgi:hypothetical protein
MLNIFRFFNLLGARFVRFFIFYSFCVKKISLTTPLS